MSAKISRDMVHGLKYDSELTNSPAEVVSGDNVKLKPSVAIVFKDGDLNAAAYYVAKSAQNPFDEEVICTVLVQESIYDKFIDRVRNNLKPLAPQIAKHSVFLQSKQLIQTLNAKTITAKPELLEANAESPTLVCEFTQEYLGAWPTGVLNVHSFRTAKEAQDLYAKESLDFHSVIVFNETLAGSYELATALDCPLFYINCIQVPLDPISNAFKRKSNYVEIKDNYHYETINLNNKQKIIIFPIGTIFAN